MCLTEKRGKCQENYYRTNNCHFLSFQIEKVNQVNKGRPISRNIIVIFHNISERDPKNVHREKNRHPRRNNNQIDVIPSIGHTEP